MEEATLALVLKVYEKKMGKDNTKKDKKENKEEGSILVKKVKNKKKNTCC